ncbi:MAG TPA: hypothetical protein VMD97_07460 [Candidatus Aquilonibacter sp.]|nr:hypothetical protein [Candidatus Aquilonibacter sp.]
MKPGAENRKKTIAAGALGAVALCCVFYAYNALFAGSSSAPPPTVAPLNKPAAAAQPAAETQTAGLTGNRSSETTMAGVDAQKLASTSASLDPTLDERAMHRTESLVYSGTGRNIFSLTYTPPPPPIPKNVPSARPKKAITLPPAPVGPPPPPPINLKFFGTARRKSGVVQAFLLQNDNVYLASVGEIVAHKYKILSISLNSIQVEDLQNNNTQTLPLLMQ